MFAERGISQSPTSAICKLAGVSEGTLFNYFANKDALMNELYLEIKQELANGLMHEFMQPGPFQQRMRQLWNEYLRWGVAHPDRRVALRQLTVSCKLSAETVEAGNVLFNAVLQSSEEAMNQGTIRRLPHDYLAALMDAQAAVTVEFMLAHPAQAREFEQRGFELLWHGIGVMG